MLQANSKFQIIINCHICNEAQKIIRYLYQPIIGSAAVSLYFMLLTERESMQMFNLDNTHVRLQNLLQLSLPEIERARHKLEAVGLLDVFINQETMFYFYEILAPLGASEFYKNEQFNQLLVNKLNENDYERTYFLFIKNKVELVNYQKVTQNFDDVFKSGQEPALINNSETKQELSSLLITDDDVKGTKINQLKIKTPEQFLINLKKTALSKKDMFLLTKLANHNLKPEVINCLLEYVWYKNNHVLVLPYLDKIANSLQEQGINSAELAMEYLRTAYTQSLQKKQAPAPIKTFKPKLNYQVKWSEGIIPKWLKEPTNYQN